MTDYAMVTVGTWLLSAGLAAVPAGEAAAQDGCFGTPPDAYDAGAGPECVAVGDLDGDGALDMAVANAGDLSVLRNRGDGTFDEEVRYPVGADFVAMGDFDDDGWLDLAITNDSNSVGILRNLGDGTFVEGGGYSAGNSSQSVAVGDFDGDGALDLAVANFGIFDASCACRAGDDVSVLRNLGDGTFDDGNALHYEAGDGPRSVAVGDLNGDGAPDLAVANGFSGDVSVFLNLGDGTFDEELRYPVGDEDLRSIAVGDLDGDCALDLVVAPSGSDPGDVSVLRNSGDGTFEAPARYAAGDFPWSVAVGDLDGDGAPDLAVAELSGDVSVLYNHGEGTFGAPVPYVVGDNADSVAVGDLDGDGALDLAIANRGQFDGSWVGGAVSIFKNVCPPPCPADFNGDRSVGFADLTELLNNWGSCGLCCRWDLDRSDHIGFGDLTQLLAAWGPCA